MFPLSYPLSSRLLSVFQSSYSSVPDRYWFGDNLDVNAVVIAVYAFVMLLFLLTIGSIIWYLYGHRRLQATFTQAFSECCDIDIQSMTVSSKHTAVCFM